MSTTKQSNAILFDVATGINTNEQVNTLDQTYFIVGKEQTEAPLTMETSAQYQFCILQFAKQGDVRFLSHVPQNFQSYFMFKTRDKYGNTPLMLSILTCKINSLKPIFSFIHPSLLQSFLENKNVNGNTALHIALLTKQPNLLPFLLQAGANPLTTDNNTNNMYHIAAQLGLQMNSVSYYINFHFELLTTYNDEGKTPLHIALQTQNMGLIHQFLQPFINDSNYYQWVTANEKEIASICKKPELKTGNSPLMMAAMIGNSDILELICQLTAAPQEDGNFNDYINEQNYCGNTALHLAASYGHPYIYTTLLNKGSSTRISNYEAKKPVLLNS